MITKITIKNVRGINDLQITERINPNKISFFVASNGFGKSSIAQAFNGLKRDKIDIDESQFHQKNYSNKPSIFISDNDGTYEASIDSNTISKNFDIFVLRTNMIVKSKKQNRGTYTSVSNSLRVDDVVLYNTIPESSKFLYKITEYKTADEIHSKFFINLKFLFDENSFNKLIFENKEIFSKLIGERNKKKIEKFIHEFNSKVFKKSDISNVELQNFLKSDILSIVEFSTLLNCFSKFFNSENEIENIINLIQLINVYENNSNKITAINKYVTFKYFKEKIDKTLELINNDWINFKTIIKNGQLLLKFPEVNEISNGERDIVIIISKLIEFMIKIKKDKSIIIIDEVFDYLDEANVITAQFYILELIKQFENKKIYPILLTHLDPLNFKYYLTTSQNIIYLSRRSTVNSKYSFDKVLKDRANCKKTNIEIYKSVSSNYLHYSPTLIDSIEYFKTIGVDEQIHSAEQFKLLAKIQLERYCSGKNFDVLLTCCALRVLVEEKVYDRLDTSMKEEFLSMLSTVDKLSFAVTKGVTVPDIFFLLGFLYNEAMHLDNNLHKLKKLAINLENEMIKTIIKNVFTYEFI